MFNPGLKIGETIKNSDIVETFQCGNMGGMRRSKATNTLVIISDYTKGIYHDKWIGGVLHYTGMGKSGDQDINWAQNATLANCRNNGVDVHLFEVMNEGEYVYCGRVELVDNPYTEMQPGEDGIDREVWMFPIRPVPDVEYAKILAEKKKRGNKSKSVAPVTAPVAPKPEPKPPVVIPPEIVGKKVKHKTFGVGTITAISGTSIDVNFEKIGLKKMGYEFCMEKKMLEFI